ncbi:MAG: hypothetical protein RL885_28320 [Planctomycetota bacterium]
MPAEVSLDKRIAAAKQMVKSGRYTLVGPLQSELKKKFGKGIPPAMLGEVFGTSGRKKTKSQRKARGHAAASTAPKRGPGRPRKTEAPMTVSRSNGAGFAIDVSASNGLDYWADLVGYLNQNTTGRTKFSIRLDGETASLVAE